MAGQSVMKHNIIGSSSLENGEFVRKQYKPETEFQNRINNIVLIEIVMA